MSENNEFSFENPQYRKTYWHTCSHVMAQAVKRLWPEVKLAIGPSIDRTGNVLPWFGLYDGAVGARVSEMYARRAGTCADRIHACAAEGSISKTGINIERSCKTLPLCL